MSERRRLVLLAVGAFFGAQLLSYQVAAFRSKSVLAVLTPAEETAGFACLHRSERRSVAPIGISGSYVIDPFGGGIVVSPSAGAVSVRIITSRPGRTDSVVEIVVSAGETLFVRSGLFRMRTEITEGSASSCEGLLASVGTDSA
jgi:hypothetical protein